MQIAERKFTEYEGVPENLSAAEQRCQLPTPDLQMLDPD